jgi:hypothetical protein
VLAAALGLMTACSGGASGPPVTQQRGVDSFHSIDLRGATNASVLIGAATSVAVTADAHTLERFDTRVQNGTLVLENKDGLSWFGNSRKVDIKITTPSLNALAINGAGNVTINGVNGSALKLSLQGAGNLEASGQTTTLNARINGAGNMDLSHLVAGDATLSVNGAGSLAGNVTGSLLASVNGVGSITYAGNPQKVGSDINGVGHISAAGK